jgi:hypothetical protein
VEPKKIKDDITEQVRRNPGKSLLVAAAAAFLRSRSSRSVSNQ